MRILGGSAGRMALRGPVHAVTRPLTALIKKSLFDQLRPRISGADVLDLFAGSGSFGIEALSRGCRHATFVESHREVARSLRHNLTTSHQEEGACEVVVGDAVGWVERWARDRRQWTFVFVDPPFPWSWPKGFLELLLEVTAKEGRLIVRRHVKFEWPLTPGRAALDRERRYGESLVRWYKHGEI